MYSTAVSKRVTLANSAGARFMATKVKNFINGVFEESKASKWIEVHNPATTETVCLVPHSTDEEMKRAEEGAKAAFKTWREVPIQQRQRVFLNMQK